MIRAIAIVAVLFVLAYLWAEVQKARTRRAERTVQSDSRGVAVAEPYQRVDDATLAATTARLKAALAADAVSLDDAVGSLMRTCGLAEDDARRRLADGRA